MKEVFLQYKKQVLKDSETRILDLLEAIMNNVKVMPKSRQYSSFAFKTLYETIEYELSVSDELIDKFYDRVFSKKGENK